MHYRNALILIAMLVIPVHLPAASEDSGEQTERKPMQYFELKPSLVANLQNGAKYIRCDIQLMTEDEEHLELIRLHAPALRHELYLLMSDQDGAKLKDPKGKEQFRKGSLKALNGVMKNLAGQEVVNDLFFTSFFVR